MHRWFFSSVVEGVSATLLDAGYDLTLYNVSEGQERRHSVLNDFLLRKRVDAVIAVSLELSEAEIQQLLAIHRPIVGIGGPLPGASTIRIDDSGIAQAAARHLIQLGHSKIAHMTGDAAYEQDFRLPGTRQAGFKKAMNGCRAGGPSGVAGLRRLHDPGRLRQRPAPAGQLRGTAHGGFRRIR